MTDRRLTPANARVAARHLEGHVAADRFVDPTPMRVEVPLAVLRQSPDGKRDREVLRGCRVDVYEDVDGWSFVQSGADGYVGYLRSSSLAAPRTPPTHRVITRATHGYHEPDIKSAECCGLSMGSTVAVDATDGRFANTDAGFVPADHLRPVTDVETDPVAVAERLSGAPYLWGGNSCWGIDCSGLVQIALHLCGQACPGDSDLQEAALGDSMPPGTLPQRGDLLFWNGHVAWVSDTNTLFHATAGYMAAVYEPLSEAISRIAAQGDGDVTRHARLNHA